MWYSPKGNYNENKNSEKKQNRQTK
jgi:hypothetical protein